MKQWCIWLLACLAGISLFAATDGSAAEFTATLPDGTTVELVGLRCFDKLDLEKFKDRDIPWWRPDGSSLRRPPNSWRGGGVGGGGVVVAVAAGFTWMFIAGAVFYVLVWATRPR